MNQNDGHIKFTIDITKATMIKLQSFETNNSTRIEDRVINFNANISDLIKASGLYAVPATFIKEEIDKVTIFGRGQEHPVLPFSKCNSKCALANCPTEFVCPPITARSPMFGHEIYEMLVSKPNYDTFKLTYDVTSKSVTFSNDITQSITSICDGFPCCDDSPEKVMTLQLTGDGSYYVRQKAVIN